MTATTPDPSSEPESTDRPPGGLRRVLVAEDNKLNIMLITEQLRAIGYAAEIQRNGFDALARWRSGGFAAVLTDINMPGMNGFELAVAIRSEETEGAHTPIIAFTADAFLEQSSKWKTAGFDACLTKPIELASLKAALEKSTTTGDLEVAPRAEGDDSAEPVERATLPSIIGNDPRAIAEFLATFSRAAQAAAAEMSAAMQSGRRAQVGSHAHQLRGSAGAVGAARLSSLCACIESAVLAGDEHNLAAAWAAFPGEVCRVTEWISAQTTSGPAKRDSASS
jgi:two-component system, sensor histidine kinase and response regulator